MDEIATGHPGSTKSLQAPLVMLTISRMEQAIERISKTVTSYAAGDLSRSLATIELVSAFKVICKKSDLDPATVEADVSDYIEAVLARFDDGAVGESQTVEGLRHVYEAAHNRDPRLSLYLSGQA